MKNKIFYIFLFAVRAFGKAVTLEQAFQEGSNRSQDLASQDEKTYQNEEKRIAFESLLPKYRGFLHSLHGSVVQSNTKGFL